MKSIESEVIIKEQEPGIDGIYKQIEWAGRHCYKSHDKITADSAKEFVDRMIKSKHGAMLECGTVYLSVPKEETEIIGFHGWCQYSKVRSDLVMEEPCNWLITTNMRVLVEHDRLRDLKYICEPTERHEKRITARFTCDMGVGRELTRHRTLSFAQESTRYCNYGKSKFGEELTFIIPTWANIPEGRYTNWDGDWCDVEKLTILKKDENDATDQFLHLCDYAEKSYMSMLDRGSKPQEARQVLPLGLKTEIVVTGFESDWEHFFELRTAKSAHPDCVKLAVELKQKLMDNGYGFNGNLEND